MDRVSKTSNTLSMSLNVLKISVIISSFSCSNRMYHFCKEMRIDLNLLVHWSRDDSNCKTLWRMILEDSFLSIIIYTGDFSLDPPSDVLMGSLRGADVVSLKEERGRGNDETRRLRKRRSRIHWSSYCLFSIIKSFYCMLSIQHHSYSFLIQLFLDTLYFIIPLLVLLQ